MFEDIRYGIFYIKELSAPKNYQLSDKIIKLEINDKGVFIDEKEVKANSEGIYTFEFENKKIETPNTGDNSNITLWTIIFIISIISIISIGIYEYKKKKILRK